MDKWLRIIYLTCTQFKKSTNYRFYESQNKNIKNSSSLNNTFFEKLRKLTSIRNGLAHAYLEEHINMEVHIKNEHWAGRKYTHRSSKYDWPYEIERANR